MNTIGELLARNLDRKIEEIIQVDQADEQSVYEEITEYIATDSILRFRFPPTSFCSESGNILTLLRG